MTSAEWAAATDPTPMMKFIKKKTSIRKQRLLACAILRSAPFSADGRSMWDLAETFDWFEQKSWRHELSGSGEAVRTDELVAVTCHDAVETAERYSDRVSERPCLATAAFATFAARYAAEADTFGFDPQRTPGAEYRYRIAQCFEHVTTSADSLGRWMIPNIAYLDPPVSHNFLPQVASIIRDIRYVGRGFYVKPAWCTSTVVALAGGIYESRDFSPMPILADALQDAGCDNDDILNHCRDANQVHVRGCWVVDLVLGKS